MNVSVQTNGRTHIFDLLTFKIHVYTKEILTKLWL